MSIMELGALGEFLGSIGVIATLVYLAIQIRQNTHALDESRKLAMAQAYQARAIQIEGAWRENVHSHYFPSIQNKMDEHDVDALSPEEHARYRSWQIATYVRLDNMHYQYQRGFFDEEFYQSSFKPLVRQSAPTWAGLALGYMRPSFREEVERILSESEAESEEHQP